MTDSWSIEGARAQLGELVKRAQNGEAIVITSYRKPAARIVPVDPPYSLEDLAGIVDRYDIVEVTSDLDGYEAENLGRVAVQREGELVAFVEDVDEGVALVQRETGVRVTAVEAVNYASGNRWTLE